MVLNKNQFLIYNHNYPSARLAQWGQKYYDAGTYEHGLVLNQLWTLEPHSYQKGCYYIVNEYWPNWSIADSKHNFYIFDGPHWDDQLFRFVPSGSDGFFYIYNCLYTNDRIAKYGVGDGEISMYDGPRYRDQLWKLVPRFKAGFRTL